MNGNGHEIETLESLLEDIESFESDESDESDEARRRGRRGSRRPPPRTAPGTGLGSPRPNTQYVTQTQLQTSLAKVGAQIKTNSDAIKSLSDRASAQTDVLTKEVATRKKEGGQIRRDLNQTRQMSAILPLLSKPSSVQLAKDATDPATGATAQAPKVLVESGDTLSTLLPLMLMGGMGGSSGSSGGGMFGGDDSGMMMLVLALSLSRKP